MNHPVQSKDKICTRNRKTKASFPLLRYFTLISLSAIILASIFLGTYSKKIFVDNLIKSEERSNVALTQLLANSVWPHFHKFIKEAGSLTGDQIREHPKTFFLQQLINNEVNGLDVIKIKIYNLDGLTIFSSDFKQIGNSKKSHKSFLQAKQGKVISKLSFRDKIYAKKEFIQNRNVIASYVPVRLGNKNNIEGVFEVYKDVTQIVQRIDAIQQKVIVGVVGTLAILFFILFFVVRNADKIIKEYNKEQEEVTEKIRHVAFYDALTGLPNRVLFKERLEHAIQMAEPSQKLIVLMFIDLDRFKQVNDNLGHEAGDQLLRLASQRFTECVRPSDTVSRISGDEFTIILENLSNIEVATSIAQRIVTIMGSPFALGDKKVHVTCSIGISIYPFNDDNAESLVKKADAAMFFSKSYGRNNYHYYSPKMIEHGSELYQLEAELSIAIEKSQFYLTFQPKIDITDWSMHGMEALVRWNNPLKGIISPEVFIPLLEETGLIIEVGKWILHESCRVTKKLQDEGLPPLTVAVNISALQFSQPDFLESVNTILNETKLDPKYLELEITESCLMEDAEDKIEIMHSLRNKGIKLAIDDFGTGYSSLNYLCKLPVDTLKIDREFVGGMMENPQNRSVVTAIISFAHGLNLNIVAEGIETKEQLQFVSAMKCTTAQGYLLSKPITEDDFHELHKSNINFSTMVHGK